MFTLMNPLDAEVYVCMYVRQDFFQSFEDNVQRRVSVYEKSMQLIKEHLARSHMFSLIRLGNGEGILGLIQS